MGPGFFTTGDYDGVQNSDSGSGLGTSTATVAAAIAVGIASTTVAGIGIAGGSGDGVGAAAPGDRRGAAFRRGVAVCPAGWYCTGDGAGIECPAGVYGSEVGGQAVGVSCVLTRATRGTRSLLR